MIFLTLADLIHVAGRTLPVVEVRDNKRLALAGVNLEHGLGVEGETLVRPAPDLHRSSRSNGIELIPFSVWL